LSLIKPHNMSLIKQQDMRFSVIKQEKMQQGTAGFQ